MVGWLHAQKQIDADTYAPELSTFRYIRSERQIDVMCAIVGGVPTSPGRTGVMARVNERYAYGDPKDIEEINMTGTRIKKRSGNSLWTGQG